MKFLTTIALLASVNICQSYNSSENYCKYGEYGDQWMFFPDKNEKPTIGILKMPKVRWGLLYNASTSVNFRLYTRNFIENGEEISINMDILKETKFNPKRPIKGIIHGWLSSGDSDTCLSIKNEYLKHYDYNVIVVDWSEIAGNHFYPIARGYTKEVAAQYANLIEKLFELRSNPQDVHLIGHSLGAHISGFVGKILTKKIGRITGLDPAFPGFNVRSRLDASDANFVDVIHTCGGVLGIPYSIGTADFYPNSGYPPQSGCFGLAEIIEACSHGKSWRLFSQSINRQVDLFATKCESWTDFLKGYCKRETILMGDPVPLTAKGNYYLQTN